MVNLIFNFLIFFVKATIASEESIQRVNAPLPKRKTFEFQLENKKNSYQDAFLKFLAGEKQPTLEIIAEQVARKPKENYYYNYAQKASAKAAAASQNQPLTQNGTTNGSPSPQQQPNTTVNNNNTLSTATATTVSVSSTTPLLFTDKENYYNSSRRENLMPLNNYEYRNSYKDHYDHQGVRLNPAILKALPAEQQQQQSTTVAPSQPPTSRVNATTPTGTAAAASTIPTTTTTVNSNGTSSLIVNPVNAASNQVIVTQQPISDVNVASTAKPPAINDVSQLLNYPDNGIKKKF